MAGGIGQHPTLTWDANTEPDIEGYKIYVNYNNTGYSLLYTINDPYTTSFTDNEVTITGGRFDPTVCYTISAFDVENYESSKSGQDCVKSNQLNKENTNVENEDKELIPNIEIYPNPFNPTTNIVYNLDENSRVEIDIYDILGQKVETIVNAYLLKGFYTERFDADNLNSGIYFIHFYTDNKSIVKKIWLLK